ncbi:O-methyltransferase [Aquabacter cavernae]|uniref:O-methyltransferase n=1 Tax=Aquabacter cavernae TaxID=2496029 RepID=UPI000F8EE9AD|nr:O-methyltransferase [Aquabacter cavernae]
MARDVWTRVDDYIGEAILGPDPILDQVLASSEAAGLPAIAVSPAQGRLLALFVQMTGARRILEIGTLGGYSGICMARALPADGQLVTLEFDPAHAAVARSNFELAEVAGRISLKEGAALDTLPKLVAGGEGPFDLIFVDADKPNNPNYLEWALKLSRPGTLMVWDNVIRDGAVADGDSTDPRIQATRHLFDLMAANPRLTVTAVQTVGCKGYDGFALARVGN